MSVSGAKDFGLQKGDKIKVYSAASENKLYEVVDKISHQKFLNDVKQAAAKNFHLVIGVCSKIY